MGLSFVLSTVFFSAGNPHYKPLTVDLSHESHHPATL